uniref:Uncharacterized protein n=1 Tax=Physcomitrium patens TaxID=3218 RepID=A0A2K1KQ98_PHYPA|nr:hypothetical protein PHYPA_006869 [Physcomitrium patens]
MQKNCPSVGTPLLADLINRCHNLDVLQSSAYPAASSCYNCRTRIITSSSTPVLLTRSSYKEF